jgi:prohibitin 2
MYETSVNIKTIVLSVIGGLVAIFLLWLASASTIVVDNGKIAVMTRFGQTTGEELKPGFHFKNPFDEANIYDMQTQKKEGGAAAASRDLQDVNATVSVNFHVESGKVSEIHRTLGTDYQDKVMNNAIQEVFKAATAKYDVTQLITDRDSVKKMAFEDLRDRMKSYNIVVENLLITDFKFSPEFAKAIEDKQVAAQEADRAKFNLDRARTDAAAQEAQKTSLSPELLQKYGLDVQNKALDIMREKWNGQLPQYSGNGAIFTLPLTK